MARFTRRNIPYSLAFDGTAKTGAITALAFAGATKVTVMGWLFLQSRVIAQILFEGGDNASIGNGIRIIQGDGTAANQNVIYVNAQEGAVKFSQMKSRPLEPNKWYRICITLDESLGTQQAKIYINGSLGVAGAYNDLLSNGLDTHNYSVAGRPSVGFFCASNLIMSRVIKDKAYTAAEALNDYLTDGIPAGSTVLAEWKHTEGSGVTVADTSGNGFNITFTAGTAWSTFSPMKLGTRQVGQNLVKNSETYPGARTNFNGSFVTGQQDAYGGTLATKYIPTAAQNRLYLNYSLSSVFPSIRIGSVLTFTVTAKEGEARYLQLIEGYGNAFGLLMIDLRTGLVTQNSLSLPITIKPIGTVSGWYEIKTTCLAVGLTDGFGIGISDLSTAPAGNISNYATADSIKGIYIHRQSMVQANWAGDYVPTVATPVTNPIRNKIWPQNLMLFSEQFNNAAYVPTAASVSPNVMANPFDNTLTADALVEDGTTAQHYIYQLKTIPSLGIYTESCLVKAGTRSWCALRLAGTVVYFNLTGAGAVGTVSGAIAGTPTIKLVKDGWYRCSIPVAFLTTTAVVVYLYAASGDSGASYLGVNGAEAIYMIGLQLVEANHAGDYIPTTTVAATNPIRNKILNQNFLVNSDVFANGTNCTVVQATGTSPLTGLLTGVTYTDSVDGGAVTHYAEKILGTIKPPVGVLMCASMCVLAGTFSKVSIYGNLLTTADWALFDVATQTVSLVTGTNAVKGEIESLGSGWYRLKFFYLYSSDRVRMYFYKTGVGATYQGDGTGTVSTASWQLTRANRAGDFTITGAVSAANPIRNAV